jgi:aspartate carbamoyltransferase catalytic subunit
MTLANKSLVTIDDLSNGEIISLFSLADAMSDDMAAQYGLARGKIMASLFFEPSTRTRLSFEAAMHRLGGSVITASDVGASSLAKGESIADTAKIIGSYADICVIRHPWEGAAKVVADYAGIPVINAGDGGHQHPTQTLLDLYTLIKERQNIKGLKIALWGDLKYGRTTHSLIFALARFGADILFCPSPGLEVPQHVIDKLVMEYGGEVKALDDSMKKGNETLFPVDAIYTTPNSPHQLAMMPDISVQVELRDGVDALYVTRPQKERFTAKEQDDKSHYPVVNKKLLEAKAFRKTMVMHPLPRVDELAVDIDSDERSKYFEQAARGVPVRMALLAVLLGLKETHIPTIESPALPQYPGYRHEPVPTCPNARCVSIQPTETKYLKPEYKIVKTDPLTLRCVYCEHGFEPKYIASTEGYEHGPDSKKYHSANSHWAKDIKAENLIVFSSEEEAQALGYKPSSFAGGKSGK